MKAIRWDGDNGGRVVAFTDGKFRQLDTFSSAEVFDDLHSTWILVHAGDWIIRGVRGEFHPCRGDVFAETYESA